MNSDARLELIKLWFDFYNLAHYVARTEIKITRKVDRGDVQKGLEGSREYYASWGNTNQPFKNWWKMHGRLFFILKIPHPDDIDPLDPDSEDGFPAPSIDALLLFIPLNRPRTELRDEVDAIIGARMELAKKAGKLASRFQFTEGKLPRPGLLALKLTVYRDVALKSPTLRGRPLLEAVREFYCSREGKVPPAFNATKDESSLKKLERYLAYAEQTMINVANGQFPGRNDSEI
jgi:hypothetical protein